MATTKRTTNASSRVRVFRGIAGGQHGRTTGGVNDPRRRRRTTLAGAPSPVALGPLDHRSRRRGLLASFGRAAAICLDSRRKQRHTAVVRNRYRIALALWLLAIVGVVVWPVLHLREPAFQGKRLSVWLEQQGTNHFSTARGSELDKQGQTAIRQIGTNALPVLIERLRARDTRFKKFMMTWAQKQKLVHFRFKAANRSHLEAEAGYEALGPLASAQVPSLIDLLSNDPSPEVRYITANVLGYIGPDARAAAPALFAATKETNNSVRNNAFAALGPILPDPQLAIPVLIAGLDDTESITRENAAIVLGRYGQQAKAAVPALVRTLSKNRAAGYGLKLIDAEAAARAGVR